MLDICEFKSPNNVEKKTQICEKIDLIHTQNNCDQKGFMVGEIFPAQGISNFIDFALDAMQSEKKQGSAISIKLVENLSPLKNRYPSIETRASRICLVFNFSKWVFILALTGNKIIKTRYEGNCILLYSAFLVGRDMRVVVVCKFTVGGFS